MPGRFFLGVGAGENLNEHVVGARWPAIEIRQAMLEEAVGVMPPAAVKRSTTLESGSMAASRAMPG